MKAKGHGMGGRYDFGEPGYVDNIRRQSQGVPNPFPWTHKRCSKCKTHKSMKGGTGGFGRAFICAECRT